MPSEEGAASTVTPAVPGGSAVATFTASSQGVQSPVTADTAANVVGAGEPVSRFESAQGTVGSAQATAQDPRGAATAAVDSRVSGAVSERSPVDPGEASARVGAAGAAVDNPEAAAEGQLRGAAQARVPDASVNVQVQGSVGPTDPKK